MRKGYHPPRNSQSDTAPGCAGRRRVRSGRIVTESCSAAPSSAEVFAFSDLSALHAAPVEGPVGSIGAYGLGVSSKSDTEKGLAVKVKVALAERLAVLSEVAARATSDDWLRVLAEVVCTWDASWSRCR